MGILHPQELCTKRWMHILRWGCKSTTVMSAFKQDLLSCIVRTEEVEVTEYLGCEIIMDREA